MRIGSWVCLVSLESARLTTLLELGFNTVGYRRLGHRKDDSVVNRQGGKWWHNWSVHQVDVAHVDD